MTGEGFWGRRRVWISVGDEGATCRSCLGGCGGYIRSAERVGWEASSAHVSLCYSIYTVAPTVTLCKHDDRSKWPPLASESSLHLFLNVHDADTYHSSVST